MKNYNSSQDQDLALFRYAQIAPILFETHSKQNEYFRKLSKQPFQVPGQKETKTFSVSTFKDWLARYRNGGFSALKPKKRTDAGISKVIAAEVQEKVKSDIDVMPKISASQIYRNLIKEGLIKPGQFSPGTLRNYILTKALRVNTTKKKRKKFESAAVNQLWMADFMHGPYLYDSSQKNRKRKTYLCAIIDDHSRLIVGAQFFFAEDTYALATVFKAALYQYGLTKKFFCDNGSAFSTSFLMIVCATLGVYLIHSSPYDSPSRGKIERYFKTVRQMFLPEVDLNPKLALDQLNSQFTDWLNNQYHKNLHSGINQAPLDRYMNSMSTTSIRRQSKEELDAAFLHKLTRKVKKDSTISINRKLFEVPYQYIGSKIDCRHPVDQPNNLSLYVNDKPAHKLYPVNLIYNAHSPASGIKFTDKEQD